MQSGVAVRRLWPDDPGGRDLRKPVGRRCRRSSGPRPHSRPSPRARQSRSFCCPASRLRPLAPLGRPRSDGRRRAPPHRAAERAAAGQVARGEAGHHLPGSARSVAPRPVGASRRSRRHYPPRLARGGDAVSAAATPGGAGRHRRAAAAGYAAHHRRAAAREPGAAVQATPRGSTTASWCSRTTGELETVYDKIHLVPFGEYLPFQTHAGDHRAAAARALARRIFGRRSSPRPLLPYRGCRRSRPLICYEAIFPAAVVEGSERPGLPAQHHQ